MAISDKVIDLAPVNKKKNLLFLILIVLLAAVSVVFVILFALKPSVEQKKVNNVTVSNDAAQGFFEDASGNLVASTNNKYILIADVRGTSGADLGVVWTFSPSVAVNSDFILGQDEQGRSTVTFTIKDDTNVSDVTARAVSTSDSSIVGEFQFKIKQQNTETIKFSDLLSPAGAAVGNSSGAVIPYFSIGSVANGNYELKISQLGNFNSASGEYSKISRILVNSASNYYTTDIKVEAVKENSEEASPLLNLVEKASYNSLKPEVSLTARGIGKARIKVTANIHNDSNEVVSYYNIEIKDSVEMGLLNKYYLFDSPVNSDAPTMPDIKNAVDQLELYVNETYDLSKYLAVSPWGLQKRFAEVTVVQSRDSSRVKVSGLKLQAGLSVGTTTVVVRDTTPNSICSELEITVKVMYRFNDSTTYIECGGIKQTENTQINSAKGRTIELTVTYGFQPVTSAENFLSDYMNSELELLVPSGGNINDYTFLNDDNTPISKKKISPVVKVDGGKVTSTLKIKISDTATVGLCALKLKFTAWGTQDINPDENITDYTLYKPFNIMVQSIAAGFNFVSAAEFDVALAKITGYTVNGQDLKQYVKYTVRDADSAMLEININNDLFPLALEDILKTVPIDSSIAYSFTPSVTLSAFYLDNKNADKKTRIKTTVKENYDEMANKISIRATGIAGEKTLYLKLVNNNSQLYITDNTTVKEEFKGDSRALQTASKQVMRTTVYPTSGQKLSAPFVNLRITGTETYLIKRVAGNGTVYYYHYSLAESAMTEGNVLFSLDTNGVLTIKRSLHQASVLFNEKLDNFDIVYSEEDVESVNGTLTQRGIYTYRSYEISQDIDGVKVFRSDDFIESNLLPTESNNKYKLVVDHSSSTVVYPSAYIICGGVPAYMEAPVIKRLGLNVGGIELKSGDAIINSITDFTVVTNALSGGATSVLATVTINKIGSSTIRSSILLDVRNMARPIKGINLYSDSAYSVKYTPSDMILIGTDGAINAAINGDNSDTKTIYFEIEYEDITGDSTYTMMGAAVVKAASGLSSVTTPLVSVSGENTAGYIVTPPKSDATSFTYRSSVQLSPNGINGSGTFLIESQKQTSGSAEIKSDSVNLRIATGVESVMVSEGGSVYTEGGNNNVSINIGKDISTPIVKTFTVDYTSLNADYPIETSNLVLEYTDGQGAAFAVNGLALEKMSATQFRLKTVYAQIPTAGISGAVLKLKVTEIIKIDDTHKYQRSFEIVFNISVTAEANAVSIVKGDGSSEKLDTIAVTTSGATSGTKDFALYARINNGGIQPSDNDLVYKLTDSSKRPIAPVAGVTVMGSTLKVSDSLVNNIGLENIYVTAFVNNDTVTSDAVKIIIKTNKAVMSFTNSEFTAAGGEYSVRFTALGTMLDITATLKNAGDQTVIASPTKITYTADQSYVSFIPAGTGAIGETKKLVFDLTSAPSSGTVIVTASFLGDGTVEQYSVNLTINFVNLVKSFELKAGGLPNSNLSGGVYTVAMLKGDTLKLSDFFTLKGIAQSLPFYNQYDVELTDLSGSNVVSFSGGIINALKAGDVKITLKAKNDGESAHLVSFVFQVKVLAPTVTATPATDKLTLPYGKTSFVLTVTGETLYNGSDTFKYNGFEVILGENSDKFTYHNNTLSLNKNAFMSEADYKKYTIEIKGKYINGSFIYEISRFIEITVEGSLASADYSLYKQSGGGNKEIYNSSTLEIDAANVSYYIKGADSTLSYSFLSSDDAVASVVPAVPGADNFAQINIHKIGSFKISVTLVIYGKSYVFTSPDYVVTNLASLKAKTLESLTYSDFDTATEYTGGKADYDNTDPEKTFYFVIDYSEAGSVVVGNTMLYVSNENILSLVAGLTDDAANSRMYAEYKVTGMGRCTVKAVATFNGKSIATGEKTLNFTASAPSFNLEAAKYMLNPGEESVLSIINAASEFKGQYEIKYYIAKGEGIKLDEVNGKAIGKVYSEYPTGTYNLGGASTVGAEITVTSGAYKGYKVFKTVDLTANKVLRPVLTSNDVWDAEADRQYNFIGNNVALSGTTETPNYTFTQDNANYITVSGNSFTALGADAIKAGGKTTVTGKAKFTAGIWTDLELETQFKIYVKPAFVFDDFSVTSGSAKSLDAAFDSSLSAVTGISYVLSVSAPATINGDLITANIYNGSENVHTFTVTAIGLFTGGDYKGRSYSQTVQGKILSAKIDAERFVPGSSVLLNITKSTGEAAAANGVELSSASNIFTFNRNNVTVSKYANMTASDKSFILKVKYTEGSDVYYSEIPVTVESLIPALNIKYAINDSSSSSFTAYAGESLAFEIYDKIYFSVDASNGATQFDIGLKYPICDPVYGDVTSSGEYLVYNAKQISSNELTLTITCIIDGTEFTKEVKFSVSAKQDKRYNSASYSHNVASGRSVDIVFDKASGAEDMYRLRTQLTFSSEVSFRVFEWSGYDWINGQTVTSGNIIYPNQANTSKLKYVVTGNAVGNFDVSLSISYTKGGMRWTPDYYNLKVNVINNSSANDSVTLTASAAVAKTGAEVTILKSSSYGMSDAVFTIAPSGYSYTELTGKLTSGVENIYTVTYRGTVAGLPVSKSVTVAFINDRSILLGGNDIGAVAKGKSYTLELSGGSIAVDNLTFKVGSTTVSGDWTPSAAKGYTITAEYTVNGVNLSTVKQVTAIEAPTIMITKDSIDENTFTIAARENATYKAEYNGPLGTVTKLAGNNKFRFTPATGTKGGTAYINCSITFNGGMFDGTTVAGVVSYVVTGETKPVITATAELSGDTATVTYSGGTVKNQTYRILAGAGYVDGGIIDSDTFQVLPGYEKRVIVFEVSAQISGSAYDGEAAVFTLVIEIEAMPIPSLTLTSINGIITAYSDAQKISITRYGVTSGDISIFKKCEIKADGTLQYSLNPFASGTAVITVYATVNGIEIFATKSITSIGSNVPSLECKTPIVNGDNIVINGKIQNGADISFSRYEFKIGGDEAFSQAGIVGGAFNGKFNVTAASIDYSVRLYYVIPDGEYQDIEIFVDYQGTLAPSTLTAGDTVPGGAISAKYLGTKAVITRYEIVADENSVFDIGIITDGELIYTVHDITGSVTVKVYATVDGVELSATITIDVTATTAP